MKVREFSLNLARIFSEMLNEYEEELGELVHCGRLTEEFMKGNIEHRFECNAIGCYFVIEIPDEIFEKLRLKKENSKND